MHGLQNGFDSSNDAPISPLKNDEGKVKKEELPLLLPSSSDWRNRQMLKLSKMLLLGDMLRKRTLFQEQVDLSFSENDKNTDCPKNQFGFNLTLKKQFKVLDQKREQTPPQGQTDSKEENILDELPEEKLHFFRERLEMEAVVGDGGMDQDDGDSSSEDPFQEPQTDFEEVDQSQLRNDYFVQLDRFNDDAPMYQDFDF